MDELDEVTQKTHDGKADRNSFGDLDKFYKYQCSMRELSTPTASGSSVPFCEGFVHRVKNCQGSVSIPTTALKALHTCWPSWMNSWGISTNSLSFSDMVVEVVVKESLDV